MGARKSVKATMKAADQYIAQEDIKHHIEDALLDKFAHKDGKQHRTDALNLEVARMTTGTELTLSPSVGGV